jgi:hypothetical protein
MDGQTKGIPVYPPLCEWGYNKYQFHSLWFDPTSHLSFVGFYSYLVSWLTMIWACAYYTDFTDGWFLRVIALFMFVWPYVRSHILCTQLVICLWCADGHMVKQTWKGLQLSQKSTIREIGIICTWSDHGQSRYQIWIKCDKRQMTSCIHKMCDFCKSYSPFHVCLTIYPFAHLVYATSHLSFVAFYSYLVSWLAMIWACNTRCANGRMVKQTWKGL